MTAITTTKEYPFLRHYKNRHGNPVWQLRPPKGCASVKQERIPGRPGDEKFERAYRDACARIEAARNGVLGERPVKPGSVAALVARYYSSVRFIRTDEKTKTSYRSTFEPLRKDYGDLKVATLDRRSIESLRAKKLEATIARGEEGSAAANLWLRHVKMLMKFAIIEGFRKDNPTIGIEALEYDQTGHRTWVEDEIAAYEKQHALGTQARLSLTLMLFTGCRREDAVRLGPSNLRHGSDGKIWLTYTQAKNEQKRPVTVTLPVADELRLAIEAMRVPGLKTFLLNSKGESWNPDGRKFGAWFLRWTREAGLPEGCTPHGLRKAICRRLVRLGLNAHQIMAVTGHKNLAQVQRYCQEFERELAAEQAIAALNTMRA
jgi:site-specific recombinase XerD